MDPAKYKSEASPGRLVRTEFPVPQRVGAHEKPTYEEGYAFIPDPLPGLDGLGEDTLLLFAPMEAAIGSLKELNGIFKQTPSGLNLNPWALYRPLRLREARLSSEIENTVASATEVALVGIEEHARPESLEVSNYMRAIEVGSGSELPLNEAGIRELHRLLLDGVPDSEHKLPGRYREGQVYLGDERRGFSRARFVPPPAIEIPPLMRDLVRYMDRPPRGMPVLFAIGLAHYQFETIHPFADGNGRLGRMLITLSMCSGGLIDAPLIYPSGYINTHKDEYYDRLLAVSEAGDWLGWLLFFLEAVRTESIETRSCMERLLGLRQQYVDRLEGRALSQNILQVIDMLFENLAVNARTIHKRIGGSQQTAHNYIKILVKNGTLEEVTGMKKDQIYVAREILDIADQQ